MGISPSEDEVWPHSRLEMSQKLMSRQLTARVLAHAWSAVANLHRMGR
jgi:hypothetical protein